MRTFSNANFFHSQISRYKPNTPRTSSRASICLRTHAYESFAKRTFPLRTLAYEPFLSELFEFEAYPMWTFYIMDCCRYELFTIRTLSHNAYEHLPPKLCIPIRTLCLRTSVREAPVIYLLLPPINTITERQAPCITVPQTISVRIWCDHYPTDDLSLSPGGRRTMLQGIYS